ncbi:MAG: ISNCY family transposase, partial [Nanoarchaeota archaeon]
TRTKRIRELNSLMDDIISGYKEDSSSKKRDWRTYEQQVTQRLKVAFRELKPLVHEAASVYFVSGETKGAKHALSVEQRVLALLMKHFIGKSNRTMASMFVFFSLLSDIEVSYKTVERFYSDPEVIVVLHNLHAIILKKKDVTEADGSGDGTGYSLTVKVNYETEAQKLKESIKDSNTQMTKKHKKKLFVYSFKLIDLKSNMYVGFGTSFKSEQQAFFAAIEMIEQNKIKLLSLRLDKYYSCQEYVRLLSEKFPGIEITVIPKKNATIKGSWEWKRTMSDYVTDPVGYLENYYKRNRSESSFSEDKKRTGWQLGQKRAERIATADMLTSLWHNLSWMGRT